MIIMPHRGPKFMEMYDHTQRAFKDFFKIPDDYYMFFTYSATDGMDILIEAIVEENISHISNGTFGDLFETSSKSFQKNVKKVSQQCGKRVSIDDIGSDHEVLCITANETSTGIQYSNEELQIIRENNKDAFYFIDATSSFWALKYDISLADAWIFSVQKNFWLPSGLWVLIVDQRLIDRVQERQKQWKRVWGHNSLIKLYDFHKNHFTPATPNSLLIAGLGYISEEFRVEFENIEKLDAFTKQKAEYFYNQIEKIEWVHPYNKGDWCSVNTFVIEVEEKKWAEINARLVQNGYSVSPGLFELQGKVIRIANFPVHKMDDLKALIELLK